MKKGNRDAVKVKKPFYKKWWFWVIIVVIVLAIGANSGSKDKTDSVNTSSTTEKHIYDNAEVKDVLTGTGEKIGEYSQVWVNSEDVTEEALADWYFNYVSGKDFSYSMILYSDKKDGKNVEGVHESIGYISVGVIFTQDNRGDYAISEAGAEDNATLYFATDGKLQKLE